MPPVDKVHDGYFATTPKGVPKDIREGQDTKDAETAYQRIMQNKEKLLSFTEPLRFIFSHSALVEGWDNPNVFTICNLQEGRSQLRKRQQIGRGLRLPVMENGERCRVDDINFLTVIAHEEFAKFAGDLQREISEETGTTFTDRIVNIKTDKTKIRLKEEVLDDPLFKELWDHISRKTTYRLDFDTNQVIAEAVRRINEMEPLEPIKFRVARTELNLNIYGAEAGNTQQRGDVVVDGARQLPDVVGELTRRVPLTRATIVRILGEIDKLPQVSVNPAVFIDNVERAINEAFYAIVAEGIAYHPVGHDHWSAKLFLNKREFETYVRPDLVVPVTKSITDKVICDSNVEVAFARALEQHLEVLFFLKLPDWFKIATPLGNYNPDWAFVRQEVDGLHLYFVGETKGTDTLEKLRFESEAWKIKFGKAHFHALNVDYAFGDDPAKLIDIDASEMPNPILHGHGNGF